MPIVISFKYYIVEKISLFTTVILRENFHITQNWKIFSHVENENFKACALNFFSLFTEVLELSSGFITVNLLSVVLEMKCNRGEQKTGCLPKTYFSEILLFA